MNDMDSNTLDLEEKRRAGLWSNRPVGFIVFSAVLLSLTLYLLLGALSGLFLNAVYGVSGTELMDNASGFLELHGNNLNPYRFMQMASSVIVFGLPALLISFLVTGKVNGIFHFRLRGPVSSMLYVPGIMLMTFPIVTLVLYYVSQFPVPEQWSEIEANLGVLQDGLLLQSSTVIFVINFIMIAILPAIFEELFFRGLLQRLMTKAFPSHSSHHIAILISGLIFGVFHGQIFKFLPIAVLGILLGYLYWWTKSLWYPILAHFIYNGLQVVLYWAVARGWVEMDMNATQTLPPVQTAMCTVLFVALLYLFYNVNRKPANEPF